MQSKAHDMSGEEFGLNYCSRFGVLVPVNLLCRVHAGLHLVADGVWLQMADVYVGPVVNTGLKHIRHMLT